VSKVITTIAAAVGFAAAPSAAVTFDAFTTFDGTQGAGNFTYGYYDNVAFNLFDNNSGCVIAGAICLDSSALGNLPTASKSTTASMQFGTVNVPDDRLLFHPGAGNAATFVGFTAQAAGNFSATATFSVLGTDATGVNLFRFYTPFGGSTSIILVGALTQASPPLTLNVAGTFAAGDTLGYFVDKSGVFFGDSTGVDFAVTVAVPEPATWGLMIIGFAMVGVAARRRAALTA